VEKEAHNNEEDQQAKKNYGFKKRRPCRGWMDEEMIHRRMQTQQGEEPEENCEMMHCPSCLWLQRTV